MNSEIVYFEPTKEDIFNIYIPSNCDYKIVKFLNSLGGYQFYVFEKFEIKSKTKSGKTIPKITGALRQDNFRNLSIDTERTITFKTRTPFNVQEVITDLISSLEVYLYNPDGEDDNAKWERLKLENNDSIENNYDRMYENNIEYSFSNYITRTL
ncbi:hypothetical protein CMT52_17475 [Elizabethkingia anophelis]|jgi:hypothetical protein|nr:hypothetical protein [Elizabethkingia anophelis]MDV4026125.1 hypothetical protein [Elizabethkingia anophelis]